MAFELKKTPIEGCYELKPKSYSDERGLFVKTFQYDEFRALGLETDFKESFYSVSRKGVLRGLHFQKPPHDHAKIVYCVNGKVLDAVLDLRKNSPSFGMHFCSELSVEKTGMLYIPRGCAHGFYALTEGATLFYEVSSVHSPEHDSGVRWNSAGIPWPDPAPLISRRDGGFISFDQYKTSPFF